MNVKYMEKSSTGEVNVAGRIAWFETQVPWVQDFHLSKWREGEGYRDVA